MREASGGVGCVYGRWTIYAVTSPNTSKVKRIKTSNKRVVFFSVVLLFNEG
jgi:hypothetical protein